LKSFLLLEKVEPEIRKRLSLKSEEVEPEIRGG
jgi:hypothetical protein